MDFNAITVLYWRATEGGGTGMKEKIKPLVQSYVRFMEAYTPPPDSFYIPLVSLIASLVLTP